MLENASNTTAQEWKKCTLLDVHGTMPLPKLSNKKYEIGGWGWGEGVKGEEIVESIFSFTNLACV